MQKTAAEQDILDGGTGEVIYSFTIEDAMNPGWGEDGALSQRNVRELFRK